MFFRIATVLTLLAACSTFASASAIDMSDSVPLSELIAGGTLQVDGMMFSNFSSTSTAMGGATPVDPAAAFVTATNDCGTITLDIAAALGAGPGQVNDINVSFDVMTTSGAPITKVAASLLGAGATGDSWAIFVEGIDVDSDGLVDLTIGLDQNNPSATVLTGDTDGKITVYKDVYVQGSSNGSAVISSFRQTFMIPEPSTAALGLFALLGAMGLIRRRN